MRDDLIVSQELRDKAVILQTGECAWSGDYIVRAIREITQAGRVVLGFEILEPITGGKLRSWGVSSFEVGELKSKPWKEYSVLSCQLALRDVENTRRLTGLEPPYSDLLYVVSTIGNEEQGAAFVKP